MKMALETCFEFTKLIKYSPQRERLFEDITDEISSCSPGIRALCPTRCTVRADSMKSIIDTYNVLNGVWEKACEIVKDTDTIARIRGIAAQMTSFEFFMDWYWEKWCCVIPITSVERFKNSTHPQLKVKHLHP